MRVTLIMPNIGRKEHSLYVDHGRMEPLQLGVLAGLTAPDVDVKMYDDRMEAIPYDEPTDLVAISVEIYTARRSYEIAEEYRRRGVKVILGGMHVTLFPEEPAQYADSIFIGDAELGWNTVIEDMRRDSLKPRYSFPVGVGQIGGTLPRRDLYKGKGYLPLSLIQATRGCRFNCQFCAVTRYFDKRHYVRDIDAILAEIEASGRKHFFFVDDNIASNIGYLKELCIALKDVKVRWVSQASIDITHDSELLGLMAKSGCIGNVVGFESISRASLVETKKGPNLPRFSKYSHEVQALRDFGLQTWAAFTLGYDHDTKDSIKATLDFALESRFALAAFNILIPYPNTPLYNQLAKEGRHLYGGAWWLHPEYRFNHAAFVPTNMTPDELTAACHEVRSSFNSIPSLLYRFTDVRTNLRSMAKAGLYWYYASIFRYEVFAKHGMRFGLR